MDPVTGLIIGLGAGLIKGLFDLFTGWQAEQAASSRAKKAQQIGERALQYLQTSSMGVPGLIEESLGSLGGQLAAAGVLRSSMGAGAMQNLAAQIMSRAAADRARMMMTAYQMMQNPQLAMMNMYAQAGQNVGGGFDLSWLPLLFNMQGGGVAGGGGIPAKLTP